MIDTERSGIVDTRWEWAGLVEVGDQVRPPGWHAFYEVLAIDNLDGTYVGLRWWVPISADDPHQWPPDPMTPFLFCESVEVAR